MEFLAAAMVLLLVLVLFGLLLVFAVIRRLRQHGDRISRLEHNSAHLDVLPPGTAIGDFAAVSIDGQEELTGDWLNGGDSVVAFLTYGCGACTVQLPALREYAASGRRLLVVAALVPGEERQPEQLREQVGNGPVIVEEDFGGPAQLAFGVDKYPAFFLVGDDRALRASTGSMRDLLRFLSVQRLGTAVR